MSDFLTSLLDRCTKTEPSEQEYVGEDGLFYCKKCRTPTQCRVTVDGRECLVPCLCQCGQEAQQAEEKRKRDLDQLNRIRRLKANGIQEKALGLWTFETAQDNAVIRMVRRYVDHWAEVRQRNLGLLLWGDVGTGKSFAAACVANALLEQGVPVLMTNFSRILNQMGGMYAEERCRYIASLSAYDLLIIDDLGIERNTEYALEQVYAVVDERYKEGKPLIVTTNLTIGEIRNAGDVAHARIYSRVLELCTPVQVRGSDRRTGIGREKQALAKQLLCDS